MKMSCYKEKCFLKKKENIKKVFFMSSNGFL